MSDFWPRVGSREKFLRAFDCCEHHIDRDIAIRMAVHLDTRTMHSLNPRVEASCVSVMLPL